MNIASDGVYPPPCVHRRDKPGGSLAQPKPHRVLRSPPPRSSPLLLTIIPSFAKSTPHLPGDDR
jgi:hypothetical protein